MSERTSLLSDNELLSELRTRVDRVAGEFAPHDAELARTLVSLLVHFNRLAPVQSFEPTSPRAASWSTATADPYSTLRRHVSDFQLERSHSASREGSISPLPPVQAVETALLWSEIDGELETVLSLCRTHPYEDAFADSLPPEYDVADYTYDHLPQYDTLDGHFSGSVKPAYKAGSVLEGTTSRLHDSTNEKMKLDLEAVTLAIDRLYSVTPQLHNQRVELNKSKLEEMERAKRKGKQKATNGELEAKELDRMLDLIGKASGRKLMDQSVFIDDTLRRKMELAKQKDHEKVCAPFVHVYIVTRRSHYLLPRQHTAFVDQLANHSEAGRMHSQDASFLHAPARSQSQPSLVDRTLDPHALLSLPEFMREGVPDVVQQRMQLERDPEALLTLPEFIKEQPLPRQIPQPSSSRRQSISQTAPAENDDIVVASAASRRASKGNRARSMSEPLAWLLSPRSSSPATGSSLGLKRHASRKSGRPGSAHGTLPDVQGTKRNER